jgi:serine/threonine protein kinase
LLQHEYAGDGTALISAPLIQKARGLADAAVALASLHEAGYVHADFKLANLLLTANPKSDAPVQGKLHDFGLTRPIGQLIVGTTPTIGPPEYHSNQNALKADPSFDSFSLGVSIIQAIHGRSTANGTELGKLESAAVLSFVESVRESIRNDDDLDDKEKEIMNRMLDCAQDLVKPDVKSRLSCAEAGNTLTNLVAELEAHFSSTSSPERA